MNAYKKRPPRKGHARTAPPSKSMESPQLPLAKALEDEDPWLPMNAARILGRIGSKAKGVIPNLIKALENIENDKLRQYAARALGKIGDLEPQVVPAFTKATTDPNSEVASEAKKALKTIRDSEKKKTAKKKKKKKKPKKKKLKKR